jgi:uncharacterized protein YndB with AHSA1/START domain
MDFTIDIAAPIEQVFAVLADLPAYPQWLPASGLYNATTQVSDSPVRLGSTYVDQSKQVALYGRVTAYNPPETLAFHQETRVPLGRLAIDIQYRLQTTPGGTRVFRSTRPHLFGPLAVLQGAVVRSIRKENLRTLEMMKRYLEQPSGS